MFFPLSLQEKSLVLSKQDFCHFMFKVTGFLSNNVWHLSAYQTNHQSDRQPRRGRRACPGGRRRVEEVKRPQCFRTSSLCVGNNVEVSRAFSQPSDTLIPLKCSLRTGRMAHWVGVLAVQAKGSEFKSPAPKAGCGLAPCKPCPVIGETGRRLGLFSNVWQNLAVDWSDPGLSFLGSLFSCFNLTACFVCV